MRVTWKALTPAIQARLVRSGLDGERFPGWLDATRARSAARVREGDEDHLVFYALQSTRFTTLPPVEPAVSAEKLVDALDPDLRARFLSDATSLSPDVLPPAARARLRALARRATEPATDGRERYFQDLIRAAAGTSGPNPSIDARERYLSRIYLRAMRFLHDQSTAARATDARSAVATLYRSRGLSTDTAIEAGFVVHLGLATLHALDPSARLQHVVIVGPGLDLAPRTGLIDAEPPQSYQPFAVADALLSLGAADEATLRLTCLDINPRVVAHLTRARSDAESLTLVSGVAERTGVAIAVDYRAYFTALGRGIGAATPVETFVDRQGAHLRKRVRVREPARNAIVAAPFDVVSERATLDADLVVVTNVLTYFDERELALALANLASMLAPRGALIHNEARPEIGEITAAVGLPLVQSRTAIIASVRGAPPLYDSVFVHRRSP